jgi:hypothetical protein
MQATVCARLGLKCIIYMGAKVRTACVLTPMAGHHLLAHCSLSCDGTCLQALTAKCLHI